MKLSQPTPTLFMKKNIDWYLLKDEPSNKHLLAGIIAPFLYNFKSTFINLAIFGLSLILLNLMLLLFLSVSSYLLIGKAKKTYQSDGILPALGGMILFVGFILPCFPLIIIATNIIYSAIHLCIAIHDTFKSFIRGYQEGYHQGFRAIFHTLMHDHLSFSSFIMHIYTSLKTYQKPQPMGQYSHESNINNNLSSVEFSENHTLSHKGNNFWSSQVSSSKSCDLESEIFYTPFSSPR